MRFENKVGIVTGSGGGIGQAYAEALAMAWFAELPLAVLLAWTARYTLTWAAPRDAAPRDAACKEGHIARSDAGA